MVDVAVRRAFASVPDGQVHYAEAGSGEPVVFLHQTPRSWAEFQDVLPLVGARRRAIEMDTIGFGDSTKPDWPVSIERAAGVVRDFLDALGLDRVALVGHHTGSVVALEVAAAHPERVDALVLSGTPLVDEDLRRQRAETIPTLDESEPREDGSHLVALWQGRAAFYPPGRPELLNRFVLDALKAGPNSHAGHQMVYRYEMEARLGLVRARTLVVAASDDPFAYPHARPLAERLGAEVVEIPGGMVPLPDQLPEELARAVLDFLG